MSIEFFASTFITWKRQNHAQKLLKHKLSSLQADNSLNKILNWLWRKGQVTCSDMFQALRSMVLMCKGFTNAKVSNSNMWIRRSSKTRIRTRFLKIAFLICSKLWNMWIRKRMMLKYFRLTNQLQNRTLQWSYVGSQTLSMQIESVYNEKYIRFTARRL